MDDVILQCIDISKSFPGVQALDRVCFELKKGEIHALCGENGAGKSTLIKILTGLYRKDMGEIIFERKTEDFRSVQECRNHGIVLIPQEIQLASTLTVAENIFMTRYGKKHGFVNWKHMERDTQALQHRLGSSALTFSANTLAADLSMGHKQLVEIMKAISTDVKVIAFDEPTSSLSDEETEQLFNLIRQLANKGISIIYVSHRLNEIFKICDRVTVFKDGKYVNTKEVASLVPADIIAMMVGRDLKLFDKKKSENKNSDFALQVESLNWGNKVNNVSFSIKRGEILGMFGIVGSGRTETARCLFGLEKKDSGIVKILGKKVNIRNAHDAVKYKMGFVTEDRRGEGLSLVSSVRWNITMPFLKKVFSSLGFVKERYETQISHSYIKALNIKTPGDLTQVESLSGGNQQKVIIAKWLGADSEILIFDEPTRGIDVGAKAEIYRLIENLAEKGKAIIMISSELPEIRAMSDRLLVFRDGSITAEITNVSEMSEEEILSYAIACNE